MKVKFFSGTWEGSDAAGSMEDRVTRWVDKTMPIVERVTHVVHAHTHFITVWYIDGSKEERG
jgi:hypothetical protein